MPHSNRELLLRGLPAAIGPRPDTARDQRSTSSLLYQLDSCEDL